MEISDELKSLYKHWKYHAEIRKQSAELQIDEKVADKIVTFVNERLTIYERKTRGENPPWTNDPILNKYRFCNIYRELDRQTIFFHKILKPLEGDFELWFLNMLFCRSICNTETIQKVGLLTFNKRKNEQVMQRLRNLPSPKYGTAYIFPISLIQKSSWNTREKFFCEYYPLIIKRVAQEINRFERISVVDGLTRILPIFGFHLKFLFTEALIDTAYQFPLLIDLYKRFPIGPGSIPTMKRLNAEIDPETVNLNMLGLLDDRIKLMSFNAKPIYLSAENWEGIGCEFRKYSNLSRGKGRKRLLSNRS